ncbi:hypothetical protein AYI69_g9171 [Smittium culicis]|uniref:Uncharacterized protein n=1 Tax=Smittium culicis TaxID=133412 RepID=A0A1R1XEH2_9FUNG|nr:hypothetical protein AYI69_g9171 [Smittium culicis]
MDSDMSLPMEIKKEFILPNPSPKNDSYGYQQTFNKFVSNVEKAPSGRCRAAIEPETEADHHDISDIEF